MAENFLQQDVPADLLGEFQPFLMQASVDCRAGFRSFAERLQVGVDIKGFGRGKDLDCVSVLQSACDRHP